MNSLVFSFLAAGCAAFSSLFFRKNAGNSPNSSPNGYLVLFYLSALILSLVFFQDIWNVPINFVILAIGTCVGILSSTLMVFTSRALKQGPAGLTFAFQNASAIFPGIILFFILGADWGFSCSYRQLMGMVLVLSGLFLGASNESSTTRSKASSKWLKYALACFVIQIFALTFMQARCILFDLDPDGFLSNFSVTQTDDVWFMPGQFGASFVIQTIFFLREKRKLQKSEAIYGCLGGVANFSSTCLLLFATKIALPFEKGILFPCFAVATMILCNIWANRLYKENFNLKTNVLCSLGIFMAVPV